MRHVIVIGAGASGMMAAIAAAGKGCKVTILEHTSKSGRKIEITGNGKCNYTNADQKTEYYHSQCPDYVQGILEQFTYEDTLQFFEGLGIVPKCRNGYYYPYSGQATAISQALRQEAERLKVKFACNIQIQEIRKGVSFEIITEGYTYTADAIIVATGSMAAPATGSDGSGYALAKSLGHQVKKPLPALVQLLSKDKELALLAGLRCEGTVSLYVDQVLSGTEHGEIQFIKNGLSGIPVFQLSGKAVREMDSGKNVTLHVNFLTGTGWEDAKMHLQRRWGGLLEKDATLQQFFCGLIHERTEKALLSRLQMKGTKKLADIDDKVFDKICTLLTDMEFSVNRANSFEQAQVCSGGVLLEQLREGTMESKIVEGLYFAGEVLDVDAICGGYNLQWAWASGYVAGSHAARE